MSLFDKLKDTKLKSLKFGEKGTTGDSTKPYIVTDINTVDTPFNKLRLTKFDDGLIRGGAVGAINASAVDTLRIGKFLTDFPKGPLFIAKQVGLQLANPPLETKQMPTNRVGKGLFGKVVAGASNVINKLNNLVGGPTRIYNLGINTLAQVPVNAFGGHIARHGFLPNLDESQKYQSVVTENNKNGNNRLVGLRNDFFLFLDSNNDNAVAQSDPFRSEIKTYFGGAKSVYGIGFTTIHRTTFTGNGDEFNNALTRSKEKTTRPTLKVTPSTLFYSTYRKAKFDTQIADLTAPIDTNKSKPTGSVLIGDYGKITKSSPIQPLTSPTKHIDALGFNNIVYQPNDVSDTALLVPQSRTQNATYNRLINQASKVQNDDIKPTQIVVPSTYRKSKQSPVNIKISSIDKDDSKFNYLKKSFALGGVYDQIYNREDDKIMSVEFSQLNPFTARPLALSVFSAYLSGYSEDYNSNWADVKYNGRSEFFYTFNSFKKTASFKLNIPIFKQQDLIKKHDDLRNLQKSAAGAYFNNRLGGVVTKIKLGHYLNYVPCIITNLKITIPNDASWDWGIDNKDGNKQAYAMLLEADFSITVIGNEIPGWDLGKTPNPPPVKDEIPTVIKLDLVHDDPFDYTPAVPDATSTKFSTGTNSFVGTRQQEIANAIEFKPQSDAQQKAIADLVKTNNKK